MEEWMKYASLFSLSAMLALSTAAFAGAPMANEDCAAWLKKVDVDHDGVLRGDEASPYLEKTAASGVKQKNAGEIASDEFTEACKMGGYEGVKAE
jgi:hypothetical protein